MKKRDPWKVLGLSDIARVISTGNERVIFDRKPNGDIRFRLERRPSKKEEYVEIFDLVVSSWAANHLAEFASRNWEQDVENRRSLVGMVEGLLAK